MPTALITGCNTGFGRAAALLFARRGCRVFATVRSEQRGADLVEEARADDLPLELVVLDVTDPRSRQSAVEAVLDGAGSIDALVNNAGRVMYAALEETAEAEARELFDVNYFGAVEMMRLVLGPMRQQGSGSIVNVSSVNGIINLPYSAVYGASKWGLEAVTQALWQEMAPYGIRVAVVQPAGFETAIVDNAVDASLPQPDSPYWEGLQRAREASRAANAASPDLTPVAEAIWSAAFDDPPRFRHPVGYYAELLTDLRQKLDDEEFLEVLKSGVRKYEDGGST